MPIGDRQQTGITTKQKVIIAGVGVPTLLAIGFGAFVLYRIFKATRSEVEEVEQPKKETTEYVAPTDPKCMNMESKLSTPSGCGTVRVMAYKADPKDRTSFTQEQVMISEIPNHAGFYLQKSPTDALGAFLRLEQAANAAGIKITVSSAFRTMGKQEELYNKYITGRGNLAARPGRSTHQFGVTLDMNVAGNPPLLKWLRANAARFGFFETVKSEAWHWEYIKSKDPAFMTVS